VIPSRLRSQEFLSLTENIKFRSSLLTRSGGMLAVIFLFLELMKIFRTILLLLVLQICLVSCSRRVTFEYYSKARNVLYLNNIQNEFFIKSEHPSKLKVEITEASIERKDDTTFVIKTDSKHISEMTISDGKNLKKILFIKSYIPNPELTFRVMNYYESKSMKVSEAQNINQFSSAIKNFSYDLSFLNSSLDIIRIDSSQNVTTERVDNSDNRKFSILKRAQVGDTYIFHNIKIEVSKNEIVDGKDLVIKIVE
jgi:hypothetical protein